MRFGFGEQGIKSYRFQVTLDGVAAVKSGEGNFVFSRDSLKFLAIVKHVPVRFTAGGTLESCLPNGDTSHFLVDGLTVECGHRVSTGEFLARSL